MEWTAQKEVNSNPLSAGNIQSNPEDIYPPKVESPTQSFHFVASIQIGRKAERWKLRARYVIGDHWDKNQDMIVLSAPISGRN